MTPNVLRIVIQDDGRSPAELKQPQLAPQLQQPQPQPLTVPAQPPSEPEVRPQLRLFRGEDLPERTPTEEIPPPQTPTIFRPPEVPLAGGATLPPPPPPPWQPLQTPPGLPQPSAVICCQPPAMPKIEPTLQQPNLPTPKEDTAKNLLEKIQESWKSGREAAGKKVYESLADSFENFTPQLTKAGMSIAQFGGRLSLAGSVLQSFISTFQSVVSSLLNRARELEQYSGALAQSFATSEAKETLADIREAEELGEGLARINDAQTDISIALREMLLPIKSILVNTIAPIMEFIRTVLDVIKAVIQGLPSAMGEFFSTMFDNFKNLITFNWSKLVGPAGMFEKVFQRIQQVIDGTDQPAAKLTDWIQDIYKHSDMSVNFTDFPYHRKQTESRLNVPIFGVR